MQPTLEPIAKLPLAGSLDGSIYSPVLTFAPDRPELYIRQPVIPVTTRDLLRRHAPDVAAPLLLVTLVWLFWIIRRTAQRPRDRGRLYCRRCNHELIAPAAIIDQRGRARWGDADAKCGECGRGGGRPPVIGRRRRQRLLPVLAAGLTLIVALAAALFWSLEPLSAFGGTTWPRAGLDAVGWKVQRRIPERYPLPHRITRWEIPSGRSLGTLGEFNVRGMRNAMLSPDGKLFAMTIEPGSSGHWVARMLIDPPSYKARTQSMYTPQWSDADLVGFSADSTTVYLQCQRSFPSGFETALMAIDVASLEYHEIVRLPGAYSQGPAGPQFPFRRFMVGGEGDHARWAAATITHSATPPGVDVEMTWSDGDTQHTLAAAISGPAWWEPRLVPGGRAIDFPVGGAGAIARIDLSTGAVTSIPAPPAPSLLESPDSRIDVRWAAPNIEVIDVRSGRPLATLDAAGRMACHGAAISAGCRYVACQIVWTKPGTSGASPADTNSAVYVWDLGPSPR